MMRGLDFSSWQGVLTSILGLAVFMMIALGIRILMMLTIQARQQKMNRQINERLKTLMAAYRTLGGSFTGNLEVDPAHARALRQRTAEEGMEIPPDPEAAAPGLSMDSDATVLDMRVGPEAAVPGLPTGPDATVPGQPIGVEAAMPGRPIGPDPAVPGASARPGDDAGQVPSPDPGQNAAPRQPSAEILERRRRIRDAVEAALSDIFLLGTEEHVRLAEAMARDLAEGRTVRTGELVVSLRDYIRKALGLEPIPEGLMIPQQGPTRPQPGGGNRQGRGEGGGSGGSGGGGGGGAGGGTGGGGMGMGMGMGLGRRADDTGQGPG